MQIQPIKTRRFLVNESLSEFLIQSLPQLPERSIVFVTSKIVALAEGRLAAPKDAKEFARLIRAESTWSRKTRHAWLTLKDGRLLPNAGIDESNAFGHVVLLPRDAFKAATRIRHILQKKL